MYFQYSNRLYKTPFHPLGTPEVTRIWLHCDRFSPSLVLSAVAVAESNSEHPIATAIVKFVKEAFDCQLNGVSSKFQAVPGCGLKCTVSSLTSMVNASKNNPGFANLVSAVVSGSSGTFIVNGVTIDASNSESVRLGQLIGINGALDEGNGEYSVVIGNREWMNRNGLVVRDDVRRKMTLEEEQGRSAVLCAIDSK